MDMPVKAALRRVKGGGMRVSGIGYSRL